MKRRVPTSWSSVRMKRRFGRIGCATDWPDAANVGRPRTGRARTGTRADHPDQQDRPRNRRRGGSTDAVHEMPPSGADLLDHGIGDAPSRIVCPAISFAPRPSPSVVVDAVVVADYTALFPSDRAIPAHHHAPLLAPATKSSWSPTGIRIPETLAILAHDTEHQQSVITLDKDFGELAIVRGLPHRGILRLVDIRAADHGPAAVAAISPIRQIPAEQTYYLGYLIERELRERLQRDPQDQDAIEQEENRRGVVETGKHNQEAYCGGPSRRLCCDIDAPATRVPRGQPPWKGNLLAC